MQELAEHLALLTEDYLRGGLPPTEARRRARIKLGAADANARRSAPGVTRSEVTGARRDFVGRGGADADPGWRRLGAPENHP